MSKQETVTICHPLLDSKNATFVALLNQLIKWGADNDIEPQQISHFMRGFEVNHL